MKKRRAKSAFTIIEVLMSLALLAMLMTAVAFAFDASVKNYKVNQGIYETVNVGRQALLRITNDLRTAVRVGAFDVGAPLQDPDNKQVTLERADGKKVTYRFDDTDNILYCDFDGSSYVLTRNVTDATFNRALVPGTTDFAIRGVRITMTLTDESGDLSHTLAAASLVRRNL